MKRISIDEINGNEILARDIVNDSGTTLMMAGATIRKEYVQKFKLLNITYVYVKEEKEVGDLLDKKHYVDEVIEAKIKQQCQHKVKETIELYASYGIEQLTPIISIADCIITDVLEQPEVVYNICGIRDRSEGLFAHCVNVCAMSVLIAIRMKLPTDKIKEIAVGCLLHDIGITYYANRFEIDESDVTEETWDEYKKHVIYGYSLVNVESWISNLSKEIILGHHERLDGSGYPFGVSGNKIKKANRIVAVCDTFDRMVYGVSGKKYKVYEAIDYIVSKADVLFDLSVVDIFLEMVAVYPNGAIVTTNRGDRAIVVRQNQKCPTRPVIRKIDQIQGVTYISVDEINLIEDLTLFIVDTEL